MSHPSRRRAWSLFTLAALLVGLVPSMADAQRRAGPRGPAPRVSAVVIRGIAFPRYVHYDPWYRYGTPWVRYQRRGPYGPYGPYGPMYEGLDSGVRIEVTPNRAQVFVDGYLAGEVDEFDNVFQRLRLRPGGHEIAIYFEGYRTIRRSIYAEPGATEHIREEMQPLAPGETSELPAPADPQVVDRPGPRPPDSRVAPPAARFGTLLLRVQPGDAEIFVDGEPWSTSDRDVQIAIRLPEGRHRVEVRRDGFARYVEDVLIRRNGTLTLNVSLKAGQGLKN